MTIDRLLCGGDRVRRREDRSHLVGVLQTALLGGVIAVFVRSGAPAAFALTLAGVWLQALAWKPRHMPVHGPSALN